MAYNKSKFVVESKAPEVIETTKLALEVKATPLTVRLSGTAFATSATPRVIAPARPATLVTGAVG